VKKFENSCSILGSLISQETDLEFKRLFLGFFSDGDFLIEDKLMGGIGGDFSGDGDGVVLDFHFAWEVDFHLDGGYVEAVFVDVGFVVWVHEGGRGLNKLLVIKCLRGCVYNRID
jgi:hypothetical protein